MHLQPLWESPPGFARGEQVCSFGLQRREEKERIQEAVVVMDSKPMLMQSSVAASVPAEVPTPATFSAGEGCATQKHHEKLLQSVGSNLLRLTVGKCDFGVQAHPEVVLVAQMHQVSV